MAMPDLQQTVPLKMLHELDMQLFVYLNCLFSLQNWFAHFMQREKQFSSQKNDDIYHIFYQIRARSMEYQ